MSSSQRRQRIGTRIKRGGRAITVCLAVGVLGYLSGTAAGIGTIGHLSVLGYSTETVDEIGLSVAFNVVGAGGTAVSYLIVRRHGFDREFIVDFLRLRRPTRWDLGWVVVGLIGAFVAVVGYQQVVDLIEPLGGSEGTTHSGIEAGREYPVLFLLGIPLAVLLTGPGEELLFRGVLQSRLRETFPTAVAVVLTGLVFGAVHLPVYMGSEPSAVVVSLGTVTTLGLYFGVLYECSGTLLVPALIHGCFNATVYLTNYLTYA
ncbi:CPBP family intramembrane glutamic endopeptidase [Natrinema pallidum]|uniref:CPBP family intramembrane metalloprotease n=1 Tax=Natrinema pallidum TaxID=69527 RepID=A0A4V1IFB4_9EURY|nr:CPBP family intramembrane glutamic endopeptidase [Natrinema pallidum]QCW04404.1 CPBP family intramembrane metalloprotease [Natrinema pallidum]